MRTRIGAEATLVLCVALGVYSAALVNGEEKVTAKLNLDKGARILETDHVTITVGDLKVTIINNAPLGTHRAGYNGLASVIHSAQKADLFVPTFAGLNFEHIFDGARGDFQPRSGPYELHQYSENSVGLYRKSTDARHWALESLTRYTLKPPHYIDFDFECVPRKDVYQNGYIGVFWASYIQKPDDKCIYFIGREKNEPKSSVKWVKAFSPRHGFKACHVYENEAMDVFFVEGFRLTLANHYSDFSYTYPFYFGRWGRLVWIMMFDLDSLKPGQSVRFAQSPTGGGATNPAWDFYYVIKDYRVDEHYIFRARAVCKEYISTKDVVTEYEKWSGKAVKDAPAEDPAWGTP